MQILALDTASPAPSVTLLAAGAVTEEPLFTSQYRRASEELLPAIERCFAAAGARLTECDRIAVCSGPGSFTGLRIGLATAWGLGRASGIPVEMVSTLEALAETARGMSRGQVPKGPAPASSFTSSVAAVLDAGRGEVVLAVYALEGDRARLVSGPERLPIEAARERAAPLHTVALPPDLLDPAVNAGPGVSPSRALALAVARRPGEALTRLQGIYSRPSAAEEKHGAP
ncbi:MAG TPA: tRNA (adenosine(37)-N6)-threonylcarbamoyltransferase complex dimerization subunit type 1 TsaB [Thermoanaerobaculia bacterium]|jgi:tRNA threonylcarbamoyladenosine biosynthesis protein TsaB|nr:tRNA (adenosine(37)-N6)-threonylcarbamoyltransferase complex dimerization subunit type 1 TsaB [Thermoanaerobaculia bacterium]